MQFTNRDFTEQFISESYQDVLQKYTTGSVVYFLDGYGNVISYIPSSSIGQQIVTADQPVVSSSYSISSSFALTTPLQPTSSYALSSSYSLLTENANNSISASYSLSSSYSDNSVSASWAPPSGGGTALITGSSYPITASWSENSVTSSYSSGSVTGVGITSIVVINQLDYNSLILPDPTTLYIVQF